MEEFEGRRRGMLTIDGMVKPNQKHVASCVKRVECGFGTIGLRLFDSNHVAVY